MTFRRLAVSLVSLVLFACSDDDAIVALNVTADDDVPVVPLLHVTITQESRTFVYDFAPPTEMPTGGTGPSIKNSFFQRVTLPETFVDAAATVHVDAQQMAGVPFNPPLADETQVQVEKHGVVAAFVKLAFPKPMEPGNMGGTGGGGGTGGAAAGSGGAAAGSGGAAAGSGGAAAGSGGAAAGSGGAGAGSGGAGAGSGGAGAGSGGAAAGSGGTGGGG